jgi:dTDP-4-dehydrorhamnose 3,5-epimerase
MIITLTKFEDVLIFSPTVHRDDRGFFLESFNKEIQDVITDELVQDNHSLSKKNVFRGLHYQWNKPMGKLIRVVYGSGLDFIVDIRKDSKTFGQYITVPLSDQNFNIVWVPGHYAHGFLSLQDNTQLTYKTSAYYNSQADGCINPLSAELNLKFPIDNLDVILSDKDKQAQSFTEYKQNSKF